MSSVLDYLFWWESGYADLGLTLIMLMNKGEQLTVALKFHRTWIMQNEYTLVNYGRHAAITKHW